VLSWLFFYVFVVFHVVDAGAIREDWPDAIQCNENLSSSQPILYLSINPYDGDEIWYTALYPSSGGEIAIGYDITSRLMVGHSNTDDVDCEDGIDAISADRQFNFGAAVTGGTSTPSTGVVNTNQDLFYGILVYMMSFFGIVWLFRRSRF